MTQQFIECDTCRAKPGSPTLCAGCLNNRRVIEELTGRMTPGRLPAEPPHCVTCACGGIETVIESQHSKGEYERGGETYAAGREQVRRSDV